MDGPGQPRDARRNTGRGQIDAGDGAIGPLDQVLGLRTGIERWLIRNPGGTFEASDQTGPGRAMRPAHADTDERNQPTALVRSDEARTHFGKLEATTLRRHCQIIEARRGG